jgi:hypothetical protein
MIFNLSPKMYIVRQGDSLDKIAKSQGYANWKIIYNSECNRQFRNRRPDPNKITTGDNIFLPPKRSEIQYVLNSKITYLQNLKESMNSSFDSEIERLKNEFNTLERQNKGVEALHLLIDLRKGLAAIVKKGREAFKKSGEALKRANEELLKQVIKQKTDAAKDYAKDAAKQKYADSLDENDSILVAASKITVQAWMDISSPTFWANTITQLNDGKSWKEAVTTKPADILENSIFKVNEARNKMNQDLDKKIHETQILLQEVSNEIKRPLPLI